MTLKELEIGQWFVSVNDKKKKPTIFKVLGKPTFNQRHMRPTRICWDNDKKEQVSKSCAIEVRVI